MNGWCSPTPQPSPINPTVIVPPSEDAFMAGGEKLVGSESEMAGDDRTL